jgi:hypothetical protein
MIENIITGIASSIISSLIWLYFFSMLRPKIDISPKIAKDFSSLTEKPVYIIKIINRKRCPISEVRARLSLVSPLIIPGGQINQSTTIELKTNELFSLQGFDSKNKEAACFRFTTYEDLESIWSDDEAQFVTMSVYAVDSLSGLGKAFEQKYTIKRNTIKGRSFVYGDSFEIV